MKQAIAATLFAVALCAPAVAQHNENTGAKQSSQSTGQLGTSDRGQIYSNGILVQWDKRANEEIPLFDIQGANSAHRHDEGGWQGKSKTNGKYYIMVSADQDYALEITAGANPTIKKISQDQMPDNARADAYDGSWNGKGNEVVDRTNWAGTEGATTEAKGDGDPFTPTLGKMGILTDADGNGHQVILLKTLPDHSRLFITTKGNDQATAMFKESADKVIETLTKLGQLFVDAAGVKYTVDGTVYKATSVK